MTAMWSLNGCVAAISIDTGKCLDIEVLTKVCHRCQIIEKEQDVVKKADMKARYQWNENHRGSPAAMGTKGVERIFKRSEKTRQMQSLRCKIVTRMSL